jgi:hypothetical protein
LLPDINRGFVYNLIENVVEQFSNAARTTSCSGPSNYKHGYDRGGKKDECVLGGCLALVVMMLSKQVLNETLHVEVAVKIHFASKM